MNDLVGDCPSCARKVIQCVLPSLHEPILLDATPGRLGSWQVVSKEGRREAVFVDPRKHRALPIEQRPMLFFRHNCDPAPESF